MTRSLLGLSIGFSDPLGVAGVQADVKAFSSLGLHGAAVITGVADMALDASQIEAQLNALGVLQPDVVKLVPPADTAGLEALLRYLETHQPELLVVDPAGVAPNDARLETLRSRLLPLAHIVTPNLREAEALSGRAIESWEDRREAAAAIAGFGAANVLITGGPGTPGEPVTDLLFDGKDYREYTADRVDETRPPGMGSVFAAGVAAALAKDETAQHAAAAGKAYVTKALQSAYELDTEPALHLFYRYWRPSGR